DQEEATEVADRVVVMSQGNIEQADAPDRVWREPATRFVLEFIFLLFSVCIRSPTPAIFQLKIFFFYFAITITLLIFQHDYNEQE
ncbi:hypothetical protein MJI12_26960, partial [Salmonella enterica subsp. enterica serovar Kentucky]|nr:hypothetical protein [Salmonella enterica subsp. enterica serovar Kentucky]